MPPRRRTSLSATPTPRAPAPADYIDDGTSCQRSTYAYPSLIAAARGYSLNFRACSGAKVADVTNTQLSALTAATSYVSISVGGNDAGFADVLTECATPWWAGDCDGSDRPGADVHQQHVARQAVDALRLDPVEGAEREGRRGRLPADLHGRGLQRGHLVLSRGDDPAQPDGRPAQQPHLEPGLGQGLLVRQPDQPVRRARRVRRPRVDQRALQPDQRELPPEQARALLRLHAHRQPAAHRRQP